MIVSLNTALYIGIDFDNTIVTYDRVFYKYALEQCLIPQSTKKDKQSIRKAIRELPEGAAKWTELQGLIYGCYMKEAESSEGVDRFLDFCKQKSIKISVISHRTVYPAIGPKINLRDAAISWIENKGFLSKFGLSMADIFFGETIEEKLLEIKKRGCTHFIDDLSEVLFHPNFPENIKKILYTKLDNRKELNGIVCCGDWDEIEKYFFG